MREFSNIIIEGKPYPTVILGEDSFTGWFGKGRFNSEVKRAPAYRQTIETAHEIGVRGFSISPHPTLMEVLRRFKEENPQIICICNPHWRLNYYMGKQSLWSSENINRLNATVFSKQDASIQIDSFWLKDAKGAKALSDDEIGLITFGENEYRNTLKKFSSFCDFSLVGNIGHSALPLIGRRDIVEREIELTRHCELIPLGMCQGGGPALEAYKRLNVSGCWLWINDCTSFPNLPYTMDVLKSAEMPMTAFRVFDSPNGFRFEKSMAFIDRIRQINSVVAGVDDPNQARETFQNVWKRRTK